MIGELRVRQYNRKAGRCFKKGGEWWGVGIAGVGKNGIVP
jgi:hypothetical protein